MSKVLGGVTLPSRTITALEIAEAAGIERTQMAIKSGNLLALLATDWRIHDSIIASLPASPTADDLGIDQQTFGTSCPVIKTSDMGNTTVTQYARRLIAIPPNYEDGEALALSFIAGMDSVASSACTLDVQVFRVGDDGLISGSDLYAGAAVTINSATYAQKDFSLSGATVVAGDVLDVRITITGTDVGGSGKIAKIKKAWLQFDSRG